MNSKTFTILIVDDFAEDREVYRRYLLKDPEYNYTIFESETGEEAFDMCRQVQPDLILVDYHLPDLDGLDFIRILRQLKGVGTPQFLLLTGLGNEQVALEAMKSKVYNYLVKGELNAERFIASVREALEAKNPSNSPLPTRIIAIVDDSSEDRETYKRYLRADPNYLYEFHCFETGEDLLNWVENHHADAILLDYILPELNGLEVFYQLQSLQKTSQIPVLMLTGYGNEYLVVKAMKAGIKDYLTKSKLTSENLRYAINSVLEQANLHNQLRDSEERERLLGTITLRIRHSFNLQTILDTTVEEVREFLQCDRVVIYQLHPDMSGEVVAASAAPEWASLLGWKLSEPCFYELSKNQFLQSQPRVIDNIYEVSLSDCNLQFHQDLQIQANLIVPILLIPESAPDLQLWGLLIAHQCAAPRHWKHKEVELMEDVAIQLAVGIQQALLVEHLKQENRERRKTAAALSVYQKIVSSSKEAMSFIDLNYTYRAVNSFYEQRFGLPIDQIVGCTVAEIVGENLFINTIKPYLDRSLAGEEIHYEHWVNFERTGEELLEISYYPHYESSGEISGVVVITRNITDRKVAEDALARQLEHSRLLQQITEQIRETLDTQEIFQTAALTIGAAFKVNRCIIHSYIATPEPRIPIVAEYLAGEFVSLLGTDIPIEGNCHAQQVLAQKEAVVSNNVYEDPLFQSVQHLCQQLEIKSMLAVSTSWQGQVNGIIGLHQCDRYRQWTPDEIALFEAVAAQLGIAIAQAQLLEIEKQQRQELQRQNQALETATQAAQAASRAKSEFLANMSHEIRTPMNAILGFCELLQKLVTEPQQKSYLQSIDAGGQTLLALINDILDLSKIEAGKIELDYEPINLRLLINEIQQIFSQKVIQKNLSFLIDIESTVPTKILLDGIRLRQILFNLVGNAIKFTEQGYIKISVRWQNREDSEVEVTIPPTSHLLTITIEDTGIGIAPEQQQQIFEPFVQSEASINRKYGGTGLGLSITQRLMQLLGGTIEVQSQVSQGSTFTLNFPQISPVDMELIQVQPVEIEQNLDQFPAATVLVIDDVQSNLDLIAGHFAGTKHRLLFAQNGENGIELAQTHLPDVILLDLWMPGLNGLDVAYRLKQQASTQDIPIVIITASIRPEDEVFLKPLCQGFLRKPVSYSQVFEALKSILLPLDLVAEVGKTQKVEIERLPELLQKLQIEAETTWLELQKTMKRRSLQEFSDRLNQWASEHHCQILQQYTTKLDNQLKAFDWERLPQTLKEFSSIIKSLEKNMV